MPCVSGELMAVCPLEWPKIITFLFFCLLQSDPDKHPSHGADEDDDDDDLFEPKRRDTGSGAAGSNLDALDASDSSRVALDDSLLTKWGEPGQTERLRNRFVTGECVVAVSYRLRQFRLLL